MNIRWGTRKWLIYKSGDLFLTRRSRRLRRAKSDLRIQWGGTFSTKIDAMHFGFTTSAAKDIVNNKN